MPAQDRPDRKAASKSPPVVGDGVIVSDKQKGIPNSTRLDDDIQPGLIDEVVDSIIESNALLHFQTIIKEAVTKREKAKVKEEEKAYVVDPWLASLGWKDGVFGIGSYLKQFQGFLTSAVCRYDSGAIPKPLASPRC